LRVICSVDIESTDFKPVELETDDLEAGTELHATTAPDIIRNAIFVNRFAENIRKFGLFIQARSVALTR